MNIIFVNQYYAPDPAPTGRYLRDLAVCLAGRGHDVTVICSRAAYRGSERYSKNEVMAGVKVRRLSSSGFSMNSRIGAILNYLTFYVALIPVLLNLGPGPDLAVAMSSPPFVGLAVKLAACLKKYRYAHWVMNMYPNALCGFMESLQFRGSSMVLTIGKDMADRLNGLGVRGAEWIPLWAHEGVCPVDSNARAKIRAERGWKDDDLIVMYSGNMGLAHSFDDIEKAVSRTSGNNNIRWVFYGDGKKRRQLERLRFTNNQVEIHPYIPEENLREHLGSADVHLVSLGSGWQGCAVPCKIHDIFASGRPVIYLGNEKDSIAEWIKGSGAGWVIGEGDMDGLENAIQAANDPGLRNESGRKARAYAEEHFVIERNCSRITDRLDQVVSIST